MPQALATPLPSCRPLPTRHTSPPSLTRLRQAVIPRGGSFHHKSAQALQALPFLSTVTLVLGGSPVGLAPLVCWRGKGSGVCVTTPRDSSPPPLAPQFPAAKETMEQVSELYQNERFFGIIWKGPVAALDRAEWTDGTGEGIAVTKAPTEQPQAWEVVVTPGTDPEGWQYGTVFK